MNPCEYETIREACGLSRKQAALYFDVKRLTANRWESGKGNIPPGVGDALRALDQALDKHAADAVANADKKAGEPVRLVRHTDETLAVFAPDAAGLWWFASVHAMYLARARRRLEDADIAVEIVVFEDKSVDAITPEAENNAEAESSDETESSAED